MHHLRGVYQNLRKFLVTTEVLKVITPKTRLGLETQTAGHSIVKIGFFAINVGRQPEARPQIEAPTVKVQIVAVARCRAIRAVEADNVVILVFYPDSPHET